MPQRRTGAGRFSRQLRRANDPVLAVVETYPRGVWAAPYYVDGVPVLIAVDSSGCLRKQVELTGDLDPEAALAALTELLDRIDPVLRLVKDA